MYKKYSQFILFSTTHTQSATKQGTTPSLLYLFLFEEPCAAVCDDVRRLIAKFIRGGGLHLIFDLVICWKIGPRRVCSHHHQPSTINHQPSPIICIYCFILILITSCFLAVVFLLAAAPFEIVPLIHKSTRKFVQRSNVLFIQLYSYHRPPFNFDLMLCCWAFSSFARTRIW